MASPTEPQRAEERSQPTAGERIRPELNIEKWPAIWRPSRSTNAPAVRTLEREHTAADGTRVRARVELGFSHLGELTTEDQKTYYALVKHWEATGRSGQQTFFSMRGLAKSLRKKWGTNVIDAITASLRRLRATPITWENAYFDGSRRETLEEMEMFNILSELKVVRRKVDGHVTKEAGYFRFNDFTLGNLLANHTKPVLFETILGFRSDLAQLVYSHLDLVMADKRAYERRTRELFEDLGLRGSDYARLYERKRALRPAVAELSGAPLTTGVITRIGIERTADGKDYKLTVAKGSSLFKEAEIRPPAAVAAKPAEKAPAEPDELVRHFHKVFHGTDVAYPQSKELSHATSLIARHGFDRAKYVVDFAHVASARTKYLPMTFGGVMQYASAALASYEETVRRSDAAARANEHAKARLAYEALQSEVETQRRKEAESRLGSLPPAEYEALAAKVKADLLTRSQWLRQGESSPFFQRAVRFAMVSEIIDRTDAEQDAAAETARPELA